MNEYQKKVLQGRKEFLRLVQKQNRELLKIYEEAGKQIAYKLSKTKPGGLTSRYLNELNSSINRYVLELRTNLSKSIKDGIKGSSGIASSVQISYFDMIAPSLDIKSSFNRMFAQLPNNITKQLISGSYYSDGKTLDQRLWNITKRNAKDIDTLIKVNIASGANSRELAKQLNTYINPKNKINIHKRIPGINKNIAYQAQRFARTSISHASTETYIQGSKRNPFCRGLKWNLSPSHSSRMHGKTDICDEYSGKTFKPNEYPVSHPNCLCYPTQEVIDINKARDELIAWVNGESNPKLDKWLNNRGKEFGINVNQAENFNKPHVSKEVNSGIINNKKWLDSTFASKKKLKKHVDKHINEYGDITESQYLDIARKLLAAPLNKDVEGFISKENFVFKYRKSTNDFAIGRADGSISTLFKPINELEYWKEQIDMFKDKEE